MRGSVTHRGALPMRRRWRLVDQHRDDDDDADGDELPERLDVDEDQPVLDDGDDQGAGDRAEDRCRSRRTGWRRR